MCGRRAPAASEAAFSILLADETKPRADFNEIHVGTALAAGLETNCGYRTAGHDYAEVAASDGLAPRAAFSSGTRMCTNRAW